MSGQTIIRAVRGMGRWAIVGWDGLDAEAEQWVEYCTDNPEEFFRGDDNAPPEHAQRGEIWEWRGVMETDDSGGDDIGEWVRVGRVPAIGEAKE